MKQQTALDLLKTGQNIFLTGQAGAGKTYVLNQYISYLRIRGIDVATTASTGIAATHMSGMTIHAWSGMGIKDSFDADDYKRLKGRKAIMERLIETKVLIVDEISMLHAKQVDLLDEILRNVRQNELPFGGMQVVFSGDFFQLPPIGNKDESNKEKFAFMAKSWIAANFQICYLSEQHRQNSTDEQNQFGISLNDILNQIRSQYVSQAAIDALLATKNQDIHLNRTRLYTHNVSVDKINEEQLNALTTPEHLYQCTTFGDKALIETLKKNVRASDEVILKKGAKVMFVKNNPTLDVYNGTMGEVVDFAPTLNVQDNDKATLYPVVRLNSGRSVIAEPEEWTVESASGEVLASYSQIPLCLAWAITVHKSQGMTLDAAEIDLSRTFETGQGYVALSRLRSLDGLKLLGMNQTSLQLDEWVFRIDKRLLELSKEHEANFAKLSEDDIAKIHKQFIEVSGGISDPTIIAKHEKKLEQLKKQQAHLSQNSPNNDKTTTLDVTKTLLNEGKTLEEIASERSLAYSTVIGHLDKLIGQYGKDDYLAHAPDKSTLKDIETAYQTLLADGEFADKLTLRPIVEHLSNKYSYNTVRLALCFIDTKQGQSS